MTAAQFTQRINTLSPADRREFHTRCKADPTFYRTARSMSLLATASATCHRPRVVAARVEPETVPLSRNLNTEIRQRRPNPSAVPNTGNKRERVTLRRPTEVTR